MTSWYLDVDICWCILLVEPRQFIIYNWHHGNPPTKFYITQHPIEYAEFDLDCKLKASKSHHPSSIGLRHVCWPLVSNKQQKGLSLSILLSASATTNDALMVMICFARSHWFLSWSLSSNGWSSTCGWCVDTTSTSSIQMQLLGKWLGGRIARVEWMLEQYDEYTKIVG